jgi:hypothetical protein
MLIHRGERLMNGASSPLSSQRVRAASTNSSAAGPSRYPDIFGLAQGIDSGMVRPVSVLHVQIK